MLAKHTAYILLRAYQCQSDSEVVDYYSPQYIVACLCIREVEPGKVIDGR